MGGLRLTVVRLCEKSTGEVRRFYGMRDCTGLVTRARGMSGRYLFVVRTTTLARSVKVRFYRRGCKGYGKGLRRGRNPTVTRGVLGRLNFSRSMSSHIRCLVTRRRACGGVSRVSCRVLMRTSFLIGVVRSNLSGRTTLGTCRDVFGAAYKGVVYERVFSFYD